MKGVGAAAADRKERRASDVEDEEKYSLSGGTGRKTSLTHSDRGRYLKRSLLALPQSSTHEITR